MKSIYTLKDIYDFLAKKYSKLRWNYEIYERRTGTKREATLKDFNENMFDTLSLVFNYKDDEYSLDVSVSDFKFIIYDDEPNIMGSGSTTTVKDNFTIDWINHLLDEHKEEYGKILLIHSENCKKRINNQAEQEISKYANEVKKRQNKHLHIMKILLKKQGVVCPKRIF